jgi:hypothetical protein
VNSFHAYVAADSGGLRVIEVSDPITAYETGYIVTPGRAYDVQVVGDFAYVADGSSGLRMIDISAATHPTEVGYFDTGGEAVALDAEETSIYLADGANGWYILSNDLLMSVEKPNAAVLPRTIALAQNYPNPFSGGNGAAFGGPAQTTLEFTVFFSSHVLLRVFDVRGREVATLADGRFEPGTYRLPLRTDDLASGIYFYELSSPGVQLRRKMVKIE